MTKGGCCGPEDGRCCEALNVAMAILALFLAMAAAVASAASGRQLAMEGCPGLGSAGGRLQALLRVLLFSRTLVLLLDLFAAAAVWLSFFHCGILSARVVHCITMPGTLCFLQVLVSLAFFMELIASLSVVAWRCMLSTVSFLCNTSEGLVLQAQTVVQTLRSSMPGGGNSTHGFASLFANVDLPQYCQAQRPELVEGVTRVVMLACLLAVVSQALLAMALNGEKERAGVHEALEHGIMATISHEASNFSSKSSMLNSAIYVVPDEASLHPYAVLAATQLAAHGHQLAEKPRQEPHDLAGTTLF
eukprot:CAMPEP_0179069204 /NCGR_PEP_ID=MMETSP0796-20121207/30389_1 /TAXON_ID=73915 /ORGANISM="Pyrodinium bahamense, Strain pbaha01" /LENGTH=303 /DNA_ID=CAMNT_0020766267 /DNA_START=5 /DNA_END=916 /DNA_ORIENTATION=+